ncbi:hypothetical protein DPMN_010161 [Dreissena polymorpha]|uniref:Uncharacterized protein n=1 Tax=Dreissena polymorpha TaxID=45954 RepID=A0A9D4MZF3_DREPO|nr:hypothetical protein DPMN_010161 [Dreissena polymorpha]
MANSLDSDETPHFEASHLDPNYDALGVKLAMPHRSCVIFKVSGEAPPPPENCPLILKGAERCPPIKSLWAENCPPIKSLGAENCPPVRIKQG